MFSAIAVLILGPRGAGHGLVHHRRGDHRAGVHPARGRAVRRLHVHLLLRGPERGEPADRAVGLRRGGDHRRRRLPDDDAHAALHGARVPRPVRVRADRRTARGCCCRATLGTIAIAVARVGGGGVRAGGRARRLAARAGGDPGARRCSAPARCCCSTWSRSRSRSGSRWPWRWPRPRSSRRAASARARVGFGGHAPPARPDLDPRRARLRRDRADRGRLRHAAAGRRAAARRGDGRRPRGGRRRPRPRDRAGRRPPVHRLRGAPARARAGRLHPRHEGLPARSSSRSTRAC